MPFSSRRWGQYLRGLLVGSGWSVGLRGRRSEFELEELIIYHSRILEGKNDRAGNDDNSDGVQGGRSKHGAVLGIGFVCSGTVSFLNYYSP